MSRRTERIKKKYCPGCYDNVYNHGTGGATECWSLNTAKIIWRKEVHINDRPPWKHKAKRLPHCYHRPKFVYVPAYKEY